MPRRRRWVEPAPPEPPAAAAAAEPADPPPSPKRARTPPEAPESAAMRIRRLRAELAAHGEEWRQLVRDGPPLPARAYELRQLMNVKSRIILDLEPEVDIDVPTPSVGRCFVVGEREFHPGTHRVKASVAEYLAWMIDRDKIAEVRRMNDLAKQQQLDPHGLRGLIEGRQSEKFLGELGR
jgi:hypothetical protein